jgi:hypothetical protein
MQAMGEGDGAMRSDVRLFAAPVGKPHAEIAGQLAAEIHILIGSYNGSIPLALVLGVLRVVEHELLVAAAEAE